MSALAFVIAALDHHPVVMAKATVAVKAVSAMPAVVPAMIAMLDHYGLGARNLRRRYRNRAKRCDNVSKLPHVLLLH